MGYDIHRFEGDVDEELICPICTAVFEDPVQAPGCEHAFCQSCISEWLGRHPTCPVDRQGIVPNQLRPAPRILRNLLNRLSIRCDFESEGCTRVLKFDALSAHTAECQFNPRLPVSCELGCGMLIAKDKLKEHNCIQTLRDMLEEQQAAMQELRADHADLKSSVNDHKREIHMLKECIRMMGNRNLPVRIRDLTPPPDAGVTDDIIRWVNNLRPARVSRWGGMISTPDNVLQTVIKRALAATLCPPAVLSSLMDNAHERRWPSGLTSLETRQQNRPLYHNYVTKRIPGKQAVVVMHIENQHMPPALIIEPGMIMIFAHGVE